MAWKTFSIRPPTNLGKSTFCTISPNCSTPCWTAPAWKSLPAKPGLLESCFLVASTAPSAMAVAGTAACASAVGTGATAPERGSAPLASRSAISERTPLGSVM